MTETTSQAISLVDPYAEHFAAAEKYAAEAVAFRHDEWDGESPGRGSLIALGTLHATLALAAATRREAAAEERIADDEDREADALERLGTTVANGEQGNTGRLMTAVGR